MSYIAMININEIEIFNAHIDTLKNTSKDTENEDYMVESNLRVVNFDDVKRDYINSLNLPVYKDGKSERCKSFDALYVDKKGTVFFIEFKNGKMTGETKKVEIKMRDGLLLFCDLTEKNLGFTRKYVEFILVYNENNAPIVGQEKKEYEKEEVLFLKQQKSDPLNHIITSIFGKSEFEFVRYGYRKYEGVFFKKVHTYSKTDFKNKFVNRYDK